MHRHGKKLCAIGVGGVNVGLGGRGGVLRIRGVVGELYKYIYKSYVYDL